MRKFINLVALAVLLFAPSIAWAQNQTITVCDGTATNQYVPFYGYYADEAQNGQMIYPADSLTAMTGRPIQSMTFYISETGYGAGASSIGNWIVSLGIADGTTLSGINTSAALTQVYSGALSFNSAETEMTVTFATPYVYTGGNLLVEFNHPNAADYYDITFLGVNANGASYCYNGQRDFLPKVSFECGAAASCMPVMSLSATNITSDGLTLSWVDTLNSGATYSIDYWTGTDTLNVTTSSTSYTFTGLDANSTYHFAVKTLCSASDESVVNSATFRTACGGSTCDITLQLGSSSTYIDPWSAGAQIQLWQDNAMVGSTSTSGTLEVCGSSPITVRYSGASYSYYDSYATITVLDGGGSTVYSGGSGDILATIATPCPTCIQPTALTVDSVDQNNILISWTPRSGATLFAVYQDNVLIDGNVSDTTYFFTSLSANTLYNLGVQAICSSDDSSSIANISVRTACGDMILPFSVDFEDAAYNGAWYPCWDSTIAAGTDPSVNNVRNHTDGGTYAMYLQAKGAESYNLVVGPEMDATGDNIYCRFWAYRQNGWIKAGVITNPRDTSTFIPLVNIDNASGWNEYEFTTDTLDPNANYRIAWLAYHSSPSTYGTQIGEIDDIYVSEIPSCLRVNSVSIVDADSASITISWVDTVNSGASYTITNLTDNTEVSGITDTVYTFTGLNSISLYNFSVTVNCSSGDAEPVSISARTTCGEMTLPYVESFEDATGHADCWTLVATGNIGGSNGMGIVSLSGHKVLRFSSYNNASDYNQYGYSPKIEDASAYTALQVRVRYATYGNNDKLRFGYITPTDTIWDPTDYTTGGQSDFQYYEAFVPTNTLKLAVHYYGSYSYYAWIDSVIVNPIESSYCFAVGNPQASNITANSATISWTADESQSAWLVRIDSTIYSTADTFYTLGGLDARTSYTVYIAADCSDGTSDWVSTQFTTDCANGSCDITVDMADSYSDGWNGNSQINFYQNGIAVGSAKLTSGASGTATVNVCSGIPVSFSWQTGSYDDEDSYIIHDGGGSVLYNSADGGVNHTDSVANACPSCITPDSLVLTYADSNELEFAWRVVDSVYTYIVCFNGGTWENVSTGVYNAFSLTPNTSYTFSVMAVCQPGDTSNARTITVKTTCGQMVLPLVEGFESDPAGSMPSCWSTIGTNAPQIATSSYSVNPHTGNNHLEFDGNSIAITSAVPLHGDSIYVSFWGVLDDYYNPTLEAGIMTNPVDDSTFVPVLTVTGTSNGGEYTRYEFNTSSLSTYYDSVVYVAFRTTGSNYAQVFIDDINIRLNEGCMYPANVVATPGAHNVELAWSNSSASANFVVQYRANGTTDWDTNDYNTIDTTFNITGLDAATVYEFRVGFICNSDTLWTPVSAQTNCDLMPLPYFENFDAYANDVMPPCWGWSSVSSTHWDGGVFLRAYHGGGSEYVVVPELAGNITKLKVEFDTKVGTPAENDGILIGVADASGNLLAWLDTIQDANFSRNNHVHKTVYFTNYTNFPGSSARVAFAQLRNWNEWALIDNINIEELPSCYPIDSLTIHNVIDPDHTSFTWTSIGEEAQWQVYVDTVTANIDSIPDSLFTTVSVRSYEIPMGTIQGGGIYKFYVRSDCSFEHSNWTSYEFGAGTVVMNSSTTADTIVGCGLVVYDNGGPIAGYLPNSNSALVIRSENAGSELQIFGGKFGFGSSSATLTVYDGEGTSGAVLYTYNTIDGRDTLLDTILATTTTGAMTITFSVNGSMCHTGYELYIHCVGAALCERPTQLNAVMTEVGEAMVTWHGTSAAYDLYYKPTGATNWTIQNTTADSLQLTGLLPDTTYDLQVVGICGTDTSIASFPIVLNTHYDVVITPCDPISDLTVSNVTNNAATLGWVSNGSAWEIEVTRVGLVDTVTANVNPFTLTGLLPNMNYSVRVRTICSGVHVDPYSDWSAAETFTTPLDGPQTYTLTVVANNDAWGTVTGGGTYVDGTQVTLTATANDGYYFDRWNDGDTNATRVVVVTANATYTANFAENGSVNTYYTVTVSSNNPDWGTVSGGGEYLEGATVTITAEPNSGYRFVEWNDGVTEAERTFTITEDVSFIATFAPNTGIDNVDGCSMRLFPNPASSTVTLTVNGFDGETMVEVVDMNGRTVSKLTTSNYQLMLDVSKLAQGAYFVRVTGEKATAVSRLIVR